MVFLAPHTVLGSLGSAALWRAMPVMIVQDIASEAAISRLCELVLVLVLVLVICDGRLTRR
jgi:type II secretory pathway component PulJ